MSALARWDAFLGQIETRAAQVRAEAEASGRAFIASVAAGGDYLPLSHQLMAVRSRLQDLETTITDTWHAKVDDAIAAENLGEDARWTAHAKGEALRHELDDLREELEPRLMAELARQRAAAGGDVTSVAAIGGHAIAQEAANAPWRAMRAAERALHAVRPPRNLEVIKAYERAQIAYWRAYLTVRARYEPAMGRDLGLEIRSRMEQWYTSSAEFEEAWVAAGRPRDTIA
jgi:hypothetical protein